MMSYLKCKLKKLVDDSIYFLLSCVALTILAGMFLMMLLSSCTPEKKKESQKHQEMAVECLLLLADKPEEVKVIAFSNPDSIYGRSFFNNNELIQILDNITAFNDRFLGPNPTNLNLDDPKLAAKVQRGAALSDIFQQQMMQSMEHKEFSGWKLKVLYESKDQFGELIKNERYFIFDKDMKYILHSFEIPIL